MARGLPHHGRCERDSMGCSPVNLQRHVKHERPAKKVSKKKTLEDLRFCGSSPCPQTVDYDGM